MLARNKVRISEEQDPPITEYPKNKFRTCLSSVQPGNQFSLVGNVELAVDALKVGFDCINSNVKFFGNLVIIVPFCQKHQNLVFTWSELREKG